jgi:hypothetical protein
MGEDCYSKYYVAYKIGGALIKMMNKKKKKNEGKKEKVERKEKKRKKQKKGKIKKLLGSFSLALKSYRALKSSRYSIFSIHVQSKNEIFICVSGSPICLFHMSTFLNACVPSLSLFPTFIFHGLFD